MVGARREWLCATDPGPQAHKGRKHGGHSKKLQTRIFPIHSRHLRILLDPRPMPQVVCYPKRTPLAYEWISDQPLVTNGAATGYLPTGLLPTGYLPMGYLPTGAAGGNRLRPWQVGSNCGSHESQRSDSKDHEFQHRVLPL